MSNTTTTTIEIDDAVLNQRGRKYKAVAFRQPKQGELFIGVGGYMHKWMRNTAESDPCLIVEEVGPFLVTDGKCHVALAERDEGVWFRCGIGSGERRRGKCYGWRRVTDDEMTSLGGALELLLKFRAEAK